MDTPQQPEQTVRVDVPVGAIADVLAGMLAEANKALAIERARGAMLAAEVFRLRALVGEDGVRLTAVGD